MKVFVILLTIITIVMNVYLIIHIIVVFPIFVAFSRIRERIPASDEESHPRQRALLDSVGRVALAGFSQSHSVHRALLRGRSGRTLPHGAARRGSRASAWY